MKKIIIVPIVEGFASPIYKREHLFAPVVRREIAIYPKRDDTEIWDNAFLSFGASSQQNIYDCILAMTAAALKESEFITLAMFGKSKGAIEVYETIMKNIVIFTDSSSPFKKIALCLVDGHGAIVGDGKFGPYCKDQAIELTEKLAGIYVANVYQQHASPSGAACIGAHHSERIDDPAVDHFNIVGRPETARAIQKALEFVI